MDEIIYIERYGKTIAMWKFIYEIMVNCHGA